MPRALILGAIQALTEFLPVSSSAHLVIMQKYLGFRDALLLFDIMLHTATLLALIFYFRKDLAKITLSLARIGRNSSRKKQNRKLFYFIFLGTLPTVALGLLLNQWAEAMFTSVTFTSCMLLVTGVFLWLYTGAAVFLVSECTTTRLLRPGLAQA